jgi:serine/threonine protein kinase
MRLESPQSLSKNVSPMSSAPPSAAASFLSQFNYGLLNSSPGQVEPPISAASNFLSQFNSTVTGAAGNRTAAALLDSGISHQGQAVLQNASDALHSMASPLVGMQESVDILENVAYPSQSIGFDRAAGDQMELDSDAAVFNSVWESGFLVEEGDEIEGGYVVGKPLGSGATSTVHVATKTNPKTGQQWRYALKVVVDKSKLPSGGFSSDNPNPSNLPSPMHNMYSGSPSLVGIGVGVKPRCSGVSSLSTHNDPCGVRSQSNRGMGYLNLDNVDLEHEISIWQMLHHPNIVDLCDVITTPECVFVFSELISDGDLLRLVNDWDQLLAFDGIWDLSRLLDNQEMSPLNYWQTHSTTKKRESGCGLPEVWCRRIAGQLMDAIGYMHETAGVVHRDIKLENVLIRFKRASSYTMHLTEHKAAGAGKGAAMKSSVEVPLPLASQWISSGLFEPVFSGKDSARRTPSHWQSSPHFIPTSDAQNCYYQLHRKISQKILDVEVKLTDFGLSEVLAVARNDLEWCGGSLEYCPPESFEDVPKSVKQSLETNQGDLSMVNRYVGSRDVWSWAIVLHSLITGSLPFMDDFEPRLVMKIRNYESLWESPVDSMNVMSEEMWENMSTMSQHAFVNSSSILEKASMSLADEGRYVGYLSSPSESSGANATSHQLSSADLQVMELDQLEVVFLPDQLARMIPDPGALWWSSQSCNKVSPPLLRLMKQVLSPWNRRLLPSEVMKSEWMTM